MEDLKLIDFLQNNKDCNFLPFINKYLVSDEDFIKVLDKTLCANYPLKQLSISERLDQIKALLFNSCRGYILKTLIFKFVYTKMLNNSSNTLDLYWNEKLQTFIKE